jgi:hypothetical protein
MTERKTGCACRAHRNLAARSTLLITAAPAIITIAIADMARADGKDAYAHYSWYVSASAAAGGDGSAAAPFNTLARVQQASGPGDTIIIVPSPISVPPLDGEIALKASHRLVGGGPPVVKFGAPLIFWGTSRGGPFRSLFAAAVTNTTSIANSGDAVRLADDTNVENLVITGLTGEPFTGQTW